MLDSLSTAATHITDHNWSFYGIIAEKRKKVNNFFYIFQFFCAKFQFIALFKSAQPGNDYLCHCEERSDVAISWYNAG